MSLAYKCRMVFCHFHRSALSVQRKHSQSHFSDLSFHPNDGLEKQERIQEMWYELCSSPLHPPPHQRKHYYPSQRGLISSWKESMESVKIERD